MDQSKQDTIRGALSTFVENLKWLRAKSELSQTALGARMTESGTDLSQKSVSNIEKFVVDPGFSNLAAIASHFGVPLWIMILPGIDKDLLEGERLKRVVKLMEDYVACEDAERAHIENLAAAHASVKRPK